MAIYSGEFTLNKPITFKVMGLDGEYTCTSYGSVSVYIEKVFYNNPATVVFWSDGTKTVAKCDPRDEYNKTSGLMACVLKKLTSGSQMRQLFEDWCPENETKVTLQDVRRYHKNLDKLDKS